MAGWMVASCKQALVQGKQKTARMHRWAHLREKVDCLVVGAGVVGLAIARQLALDGRNVVVVEAQSTIGTGTSSRNSEVIHAGIYYPRGSLKAALCIQGNQALYSYCQERGIPHNKLGKLIVATAPQQVDMLKRLEQTGRENGADNLQMLSGDQAMQLEPQLQCVKALWSPSTGILDSHSFMLSLQLTFGRLDEQADAEQQGVTFAFNTTVIGGAASNGGIDVFVHDTAGSRGRPVCDLLETMEMVLAANVVVNCAGLHAQAIARSIHGVREEAIPRSYFAKGSYFSVPGSGKPPFSRLIYPVPEEGGLGVHLTLDLGGQMRFGPDVEWLKECDTKTGVTTDFAYGVDPARAESFYSEIRKYYPALGEACLKPDYAGIRAKLSGPGQRGADFVIQDKEAHGVQGLVNLFGIESPGLTASLAIAKLVSLIISSSASSVVSL